MKKKINMVLLVDDDEATNFINKRIFERMGYAENIVVAEGAIQALDFLKSAVSEHEVPDVIFLDINMPRMNGWEFIEEYKELEPVQPKAAKILMLTTSFNPDDQEKARHIPEISGFHNKPLTYQKLEDIMKEHFITYFE